MSKKFKKPLGPIIVILIFIAVVIGASFILDLLGVSGSVTENGTFETSLVTVNNALSKEGIKYLINNSIINFQALEPLAYLIVSLISLSVMEASGLLKHLFRPLKHLKHRTITFLTILVAIISTIIGDYSYLLLLPMVGIMYRYLGRRPSLGILTSFIGITIGYGTGIVMNYQQYLLSTVTTLNAVDINKNFVFNLNSLTYIMIASTLLLCFVGTFVIEKTIAKSYLKYEEEDKLIISKSAGRTTFAVFALLLLFIVYSIIPGLPGSGILLDKSQTSYIAQVLGDNSPLNNGILLVILGISMCCGWIYGKISRNIKNAHEYSSALTKSFEKTGYIFVLLFFLSILLGLIEWTNIGIVIAVNIFDFIANLQFTGLILIIISFIAIVLISILVPSTITKWNIASPVLVPLLMRANITPNYAQFIFQVADSVGKCFSPIYVYFIVCVGLLSKYSDDSDISIFTTIKKIMPVILFLSLTWIVILVGWYLMGLPIGPSTSIIM